jgi:hypothetical protein
MSTRGKKPPPLGEKALRRFVWRVLSKGLYRESFHAKYEHPERGITTDDVIHGLERDDWIIAKKPNWDDEHGNWEYLIRTTDLDGKELHVKIAVFPAAGRLKVITRW